MACLSFKKKQKQLAKIKQELYDFSVQRSLHSIFHLSLFCMSLGCLILVIQISFTPNHIENLISNQQTIVSCIEIVFYILFSYLLIRAWKIKENYNMRVELSILSLLSVIALVPVILCNFVSLKEDYIPYIQSFVFLLQLAIQVYLPTAVKISTSKKINSITMSLASLDEAIKNKLIWEELVVFLSEDYCSEIACFITDYNAILDDVEQQRFCQDSLYNLYEKYLSESAPLQLNVTAYELKPLRESAKSGSLTMDSFKQVHSTVLKDLVRNI